MKEIISTLILGLACTIGVQAQEYNLFMMSTQMVGFGLTPKKR